MNGYREFIRMITYLMVVELLLIYALLHPDLPKMGMIMRKEAKIVD